MCFCKKFWFFLFFLCIFCLSFPSGLPILAPERHPSRLNVNISAAKSLILCPAVNISILSNLQGGCPATFAGGTPSEELPASPHIDEMKKKKACDNETYDQVPEDGERCSLSVRAS